MWAGAVFLCLLWFTLTAQAITCILPVSASNGQEITVTADLTTSVVSGTGDATMFHYTANVSVVFGRKMSTIDGGSTWLPSGEGGSYLSTVDPYLRLKVPRGSSPAGTLWSLSAWYGGTTTAANLGNNVAAELVLGKWNGTTTVVYGILAAGPSTAPAAEFKTLTFPVTNNATYQRSAYVFVQEQPGIAFGALDVPAGGAAVLSVVVSASDTSHYYAAFIDTAATQAVYGGFETRTYTRPDGRVGVYFSGLLPLAGTQTVAKTAADGTGVQLQTSDTYATGGMQTGQISGGTGTGPVTTTGTADPATNAKLSDVGNSINQTLANTLGTLQRSVTQGDGQIASAVDRLGAKLDQGNTSESQQAGLLSDIRNLLHGGDSFSQSTALNGAQAAAAGMTPYAGIRPGSGAPVISVPTGSASVWHRLTIGDQSLAIGLTGGVSGTDTIMRAARPVFLAALCIGFLRGISMHLTTYTAALPQVAAQDTTVGPENIVPGVSQAKTWGTASAAVVVIFGAAAALVALADTMVTYYGGGISTIFGALSVPGASEAGLIDAYFPLAPALGLTVLGAAAPYLMAPVYLAAAAVLRFLKT
jgi:hypothetical protein